MADAEYLQYGGSTTCLAVFKKNGAGDTVPLIVDAGGGIIKLGEEIAEGIKSGAFSSQIYLLFTHYHCDHIEGFPYFAPLFMPGVHIHISGPLVQTASGEAWTVERILRAAMAEPHFPVSLDELAATCSFDSAPLNTGKPFTPLWKITSFDASPKLHPKNGARYYRITDPDTEKSLVLLWDIETPADKNSAEMASLYAFAHNCELLIHDTMYTDAEYADTEHSVHGFGHSTYTMALENAAGAGAKTLAAFHYNPRHNDAFLRALEKEKKMLFPQEGQKLKF
ncbi:MAG: MBL fold metallo-hydrolase [Spirochaetaceae bacterium]|nr:MBL fold metallo-hydrolase [Spirochaetaceae bacterium]